MVLLRIDLLSSRIHENGKLNDNFKIDPEPPLRGYQFISSNVFPNQIIFF